MNGRQTQRMGDDSIAIQSGGDTHYNAGTSEQRAWEIAEHVVNRELERFERTAFLVASSRVEQLRTELIDRISGIRRSHLEAFEDPDVQMLIYDAQKNFARSGEEEHKSALVDLIAARCSTATGSVQAVVIRGAVEAVTKLSSRTIDAVVTIWLLTRVKATTLRRRADLIGWTEKYLKPFAENLPTSNGSYELLESVGCGVVNDFLSSDLCNLILQRYPGLFQQGFELAEVDEDLQQKYRGGCPIFTRSLHVPNKLQIAFMDPDIADAALTNFGFTKEHIEKYKHLMTSNSLDSAAIEKVLRECHPVWSLVLDTWKDTRMRYVRLNSVGYAIAHCRWTNVTGDPVDLSIWVPNDD